MKKNKWGKKFAMAVVMMLAFACAFAASAEGSGYWTETADSEGRQIRAITYTEPAENTVEENGAGCLPAEPETLAADETEPHAAYVKDNGLKTAQAMPAGTGSIGGIAVLGAVMLLVLGVALYKAV